MFELMGSLDDVKIPVDYGSPMLYYAGREIPIGRETAQHLQAAMETAINDGTTQIVQSGLMTILVGPTIPMAVYLPPEPDAALTAQLGFLK